MFYLSRIIVRKVWAYGILLSGEMKAAVPQPCPNYRWLDFCRGGCTKDRVRDPADKRLCHFCTSYKMFFEHADQHFRNLAEKWRKSHSGPRDRKGGV